jgi:hypothetical protein
LREHLCVIALVACKTEAVGSVFNHYTRVRANLAAFDDENGADPWVEASADDGVLLRTCGRRRC